MNLYFFETDEYSFLQSFKNERLFQNKFANKLKENDNVIFLIDDKIAGSAFFYSPNRLQFMHAFQTEMRFQLVGMIRNLLNHEWESQIEEKIQSFVPITESTAKYILKELDKLENHFHYFLTEIDYLVEEAETKRIKYEKEQKKYEVRDKIKNLTNYNKIPSHESLHTKTQYYLKEIAKITDCEVWTASNDKNRLYKGEKLGYDDLGSFPNFDLNDEALKRIQLIDTIWFRNNLPLACFETETSTTIYSGILRMADYVSVMPNQHIKLYIVAPRERKNKVIAELNRPLFRAIGMHKICKFIPIENLEILYQKIKGLNGYVLHDVIETIALDIKEIEHLSV